SKYDIQLRLQQGLLVLIAIFILYLIGFIISAGDLLQGLLQGLNASFIDYLPVIGWSKVAFMTAVTGYSTYSTVALILQLLFLVGCIVVSYYTADDYYEDTLDVTERRTLRKKRKDGEEKSESLTLPFYKRKNFVVRKVGAGPWAFLWSSKVKYSRGDLHPYFGFWTIMFLLAGIVVGFFAAKQTGGLTFVYIANGVIAYIIFIFAAAKAGQHELTKHYIYLIPGSNLLKIISSNLTDILRMSANILALNIPLGILLHVPILIIVIMIIFVVSFYTLNLISNFLIRVIFPNALDQKALYPLFLMLQILLFLLPGIIVGGGMAFIYQDLQLVFVGISVVNIIVIGVLLLLSNAVFTRLEWK
ncbi:MAG: putative ABC exporter domain-containing protein, partial [Syntrophomonas sp.]|nr:putative ABC exporter domain-containing protein [Syntrophomonas sp.]